MKLFFAVVVTSLIGFTQAEAQIPRPKLCSEKQLETMGQAFREMSENGIDQERTHLSIGVRGGDCFNRYTLEQSAGIIHPKVAPRPVCAIIFILDEDNQQAQAQWILSTIGKSYRTADGSEIAICSAVSSIGSLFK